MVFDQKSKGQKAEGMPSFFAVRLSAHAEAHGSKE
jgi:hypothetical protein